MRLINRYIVLQVLSNVWLIMGFAFIFCIMTGLIYHEPVYPFVISSLAAFLLPAILYFFRGMKNDAHMGIRDAYLSVSLAWISISILGALPYIAGQSIPSFIDALFESASGFTTTGSSILTDIESLPRSILMWRSLTHWIGGIGIIVLFIIIMPSLKIGGYQLFMQESSLKEKIQPRIQEVGKRLLYIYLLLTFAEFLLLLAGRMNIFESLCHSFGTVATGGFSTRNDSLAGFSAYIQYVVMIFMFLSGTNFVIHYYILKKQFRKVKNNEELKFYAMVVLVSGLLITGVLFLKMHKPAELSFREGFFQVISIITCTGFATSDYLQWPQYAWVFIFFLMFLGGSTGSTAGGIKMARHLILFKNIGKVFRQQLFSNAIIPIRLNKTIMEESTNSSILTFFTFYMMLFLLGTITLFITGLDVKTSAGSVATVMAGIGPGIGTVGPASNFAHIPDISKIILTLLMIMGRLEIYTVIILFTPSFWRS